MTQKNPLRRHPNQVCRDASWRKWRLEGWVEATQEKREDQNVPGRGECPHDSANALEKSSEGEVRKRAIRHDVLTVGRFWTTG